jgi:hypothetical protein
VIILIEFIVALGIGAVSRWTGIRALLQPIALKRNLSPSVAISISAIAKAAIVYFLLGHLQRLREYSI